MNLNIQKLHEIAAKPERKIIGLMSGTSMDGLDIALCVCANSGTQTQIEVKEFKTASYDADFRKEIKTIFSRRDIDLQQLCILNAWIGIRHAELILEALKEWKVDPAEIDLIASHGQSVFHAPKSLHGLEKFPGATLQIGDGDHIAVKTGIITVSDFRQKHVAAGGEGAPLAVYGDFLIFSKTGQNRIMLNIGGIANFTYLPGDKDASKVFSTDVGPGNTLMDQYVQKYYPGKYYDEDAQIASSGKPDQTLLQALSDHSFFQAGFPKTTGPELFNLEFLTQAQQRSSTLELCPEDVMATLCQLSATTIVEAISRCFSKEDAPVIFMSGGGMHNSLLVKQLKDGLPYARMQTTADLQINPDAKEAVLFAILANETVAGKPIDFGSRKGVPAICMGKISLPQ